VGVKKPVTQNSQEVAWLCIKRRFDNDGLYSKIGDVSPVFNNAEMTKRERKYPN